MTLGIAKQASGVRMAKRKVLGLDELMIVNPGPPGAGAFFLGKDGSLYQVQGLDLEHGAWPARAFFLGENGVLYQGRVSDPVTGRGEASRRSLGETQERERGPFFLGEDGTLYEVVK
jgi:hypothetical protein